MNNRELVALIREDNQSVIAGRYEGRRKHATSVRVDSEIGHRSVLIDARTQYVWGDALDGTWFVMGWHDVTIGGIRGHQAENVVFLPTRYEAREYAKASAKGETEEMAVESILGKRIARARKRYRRSA